MRSKNCGTGALSVQEVVMHHLSITKETNKGYQKMIMTTRTEEVDDGDNDDHLL